MRIGISWTKLKGFTPFCPAGQHDPEYIICILCADLGEPHRGFSRTLLIEHLAGGRASRAASAAAVAVPVAAAAAAIMDSASATAAAAWKLLSAAAPAAAAAAMLRGAPSPRPNGRGPPAGLVPPQGWSPRGVGPPAGGPNGPGGRRLRGWGSLFFLHFQWRGHRRYALASVWLPPPPPPHSLSSSHVVSMARLRLPLPTPPPSWVCCFHGRPVPAIGHRCLCKAGCVGWPASFRGGGL